MLVRFGANAPVRRARRVDNEDDHDKQQRAGDGKPRRRLNYCEERTFLK